MSKIENAFISYEDLISDINSFHSCLFVSKTEMENEVLMRFNASNFAGAGIADLFDRKHSIRVLKWSDSNEYFFVIKKLKTQT